MIEESMKSLRIRAQHIDDIDVALAEGRPVYRVDDLNGRQVKVDFIDEDELDRHPFRFEVGDEGDEE